MSTHCCTARIQKNTISCGKLFTGSLWIGLLLAFILAVLPVNVFAATRGVPPAEEYVGRAGVSIVRLLSTYTAPDQKIYCTGLGALVGSRASQNDGDQNNWIVADGSLVSPDRAACSTASSASKAQLTSVQIFLSTAYNSQAPSFLVLAPKNSVHCANTADCSKDIALLSFHNTALLPYIDIAAGVGAQQFPLGLMQSGTARDLPTPTVVNPRDEHEYAQGILQFLTPAIIAGTPENGTPLVNNTGDLVGLHLGTESAGSSGHITEFIQKTVPGSTGAAASNAVHDHWNQGIKAYYEEHDLASARNAFQQVASATSQFQGAQDFIQHINSVESTNRGQSNGKTAGPPNQQGGFTVPGTNFPLPFWLVSIIALVILVAILLLTSLLFGRSRRQRQRALQAEYVEAERRATIEAQRIADIEAGRPQAWNQPAAPPMPAPAGAGMQTPVLAQPGSAQVGVNGVRSAISSPLVQGLRCPRCSEPVQSGANYCPNCRLLLSPSESGLHLKIVPQQPPAAQAARPVSSIADQPTLDMSNADQPTLDMSRAEQLTTDMSTTTLRGSSTGSEKTVPYTTRKGQGKRLGYVVATRSNPGIKRKFKPNEDSVFAGQGIRVAGQPQQVGLFVVADGMGGHANGQDASRTAIQTIIDYILPRLVSDETTDFKQLLIDGIQNANLMVHQQNMEQHADMGTTVTGALIVDETAYVANVGDSRTYLYREGVGLSKVTQDHSVVASLVEAGIIKPDDIYTHPKRNQIYRSLGEKPAVEVDGFVVQLREGDKLMLCSDGLWDMVRDPKIEEVIKQPLPNLDATGDALIQAALDGGGEDNVSVIVVHISETKKRQGKATTFQLLAKPDSVQMPRI